MGLLVSCAAQPDDAQTTSAPTAMASSDMTVGVPTPAPKDGLTGYGATRQAWNANHTEVTGFAAGSVYGPLVAGQQRKYTTVSGDERIYSYTLHFPTGTHLEEAKAQVLAEFPPGARFEVEDRDEPRCVIMDVRSPEVEGRHGRVSACGRVLHL